MTMTQEPRIRALVIADSCNPEWESIPLVGWSHYQALTEVADIHLVTRTRNREALVRIGLVEGVDFTAIDTESMVKPLERLVQRVAGPNKGWAMVTAMSLPSYWMFEHRLWRQFAADLRGGRFDVVHRITPLAAPVPSILAPRCRRIGVPFVLGPLNGGLPWPPGFPNLQRQEGEWLSKLREAYRLVPGYRATRRSASAIMVGGASALADLPPRWHDKTVYVPENGIEPSRFPKPAIRSPDSYAGRPLRAVFLGRLVPYKGADMLIEAAAPLLAAGRLTLQIIGFGPEREALDAQVAALGIAAQVDFTGKMSHFDVGAHLARADIMPFPSVHEFGGAVVLEAMAMGVVPIVVAYGGPRELISPASGFGLALGTREQIVADLRQTLERLVDAPEQLAAMSAAAVARAHTRFAWPAKARQTLEVYRWVLGRRADRPDWGLPFTDTAEPETGERVASLV